MIKQLSLISGLKISAKKPIRNCQTGLFHDKKYNINTTLFNDRY